MAQWLARRTRMLFVPFFQVPFGKVKIINNINNDRFLIATYQSHGESQTSLQSIITPADQVIPYIEMLSLQTLH